jgi:hypothetical protein
VTIPSENDRSGIIPSGRERKLNFARKAEDNMPFDDREASGTGQKVEFELALTPATNLLIKLQ